MAVDEDLYKSTSAYVLLRQPSVKKKHCSRCAWCSRRFIFCTIALLVVTLGAVGALLVLPTMIIGARIKDVAVKIQGSTMRIGSESYEVLDPSAHIFARESLLQFFIPYTAYVQPFQAEVYFNLAGNQSSNNSQATLLKIGHMTISDLVLESDQDFNETVTGPFTITAPDDDLALVATEFVSRESVTGTMMATVSVVSMIWGMIPMYFPRIYLQYELAIPAMNGFSDRTVNLSQIQHAAGYPGSLEIEAAASIYNPTPFGFQLTPKLNLRVDFASDALEMTLGYINFAELIVEPGVNSITGNFTLIQTSENDKGLKDLLSNFMAEQGQGTDTRVPLIIRDSGDATSSSALVRKSCEKISLPIAVQPPEENFVQEFSADLLFAGSLISQTPRFYRVTLYTKLKNTLPVDISVTAAHLKAYKENRNGEKMYDVTRDLDPEHYTLPSRVDTHYFDLPLHFDEVQLDMTWSNFLYACQSGVTRNTYMGMDAEIEFLVGPGGFKQRARYQRFSVATLMCYNMVQPPWRCGEVKLLSANRSMAVV